MSLRFGLVLFFGFLVTPAYAQEVRFDPASGDYFVTVFNDQLQPIEARVVPANKVAGEVSVRISTLDGQRQFSYLVREASGSPQDLGAFLVPCPLDNAPFSSLRGIAEPDFGAGPWLADHAAYAAGPVCSFDGGAIPLSPGGNLTVEFETPQLPAIGAVLVVGAGAGIVGGIPATDAGIEENFPAILFESTVDGTGGGWKEITSVVPTRDPSLFDDPVAGIGLIQGDLTKTCGTLAWITSAGVCSDLADDLTTAASAFGSGDIVLTRDALSGFIAELEAQHDTTGALPVAGNAFYLLTTNARHLLDNVLPVPTESVISATADTYLKRGTPNKNQGADSILRIRQSGKNRALVRFAAGAFTGITGQVVSARIEVDIVFNADNWGTTGRTVDAHRMLVDWTELGATWRCGDDSDPTDQSPDCGTTAWEMRSLSPSPFEATPSGTVLITKELTGVVSLDVTDDVRAIVAGQAPNFGWILKKTQEGQPGHIQLGTRESGAPARIVIEVIN